MRKSLLPIARVLLTIAGVVLIIDCAALMVMGKINFGTLIPFLLGIVFVTHGIYWQRIRAFIARRLFYKRLWYVLWGIFALWLVSFIVFIGTLQQHIQRSLQPPPKVAAIIVLGSGTVDGKPTPTLARRLDTAAPIIKGQPHAVVVTSGGVGIGRSRSEANIMATYLQQSHGIDFERIRQEGKSTSTEENLFYSKAILGAQDVAITQPIAIVTSDFHTIRARAIARHQGYGQPITVASPTPLSIRYNAWFREYFAFVSGWLFGEY